LIPGELFTEKITEEDGEVFEKPNGKFDKMSPAEKRDIIAQMIHLLRALQDYRPPDNIKGWGGVTLILT